MSAPPIRGGFVKLIDSMGSDVDIVNSARISYNQNHQFMEKGDDKLIEFLMKNRHGTPFETVEFHFHVKAPIAVVREWHRHRIASYNEVSGRYVKMDLGFYYPDREHVRTQTGKPGNYKFEPITDIATLELVEGVFADVYDYCNQKYDELLELDVAKELARFVLPLGLFTEFRYKTNARSLMNFLELRNAPNAMLEIRKYAEAIEEDFKRILPVTYEAFIKNKRKAP